MREIHVGGNWTTANYSDMLKNVTWQQAITKVHGFNTIATLAHHANYYVSAVTKVLEGEPLNAKDELSFEHPPIESQKDWEEIQEKICRDGEHFALLIEQLPEEKLGEDFTDAKYGIYYRNLHGIIEHAHYHLGQIALIKKLVQNNP